ncbi:MAG: tetratricopeptide repeat protein, partial [Anaerolineales bacterium]
ELAALARLLSEPECRLLTLTGPGGIGKTRLALQAASQQRSCFSHGIAFVAVAAMSSREPIVTAIADTLGCVLYLAEDRSSQLIQYMRDREVLLVLDNYEHLLEEPDCVSLVSDLLTGVPGLRIMVTSREPLDLQSEWVFQVEGLGEEALVLFQQSARRVRAGFELQPEDQPAVARICELVGHMPLAVELTASWIRVLSCEEIAAEIESAFASDHALALFATTARDVPERHRSLSAVFEHSWQLLSEAEQHAMRRLAFFRSGFTREAAEQVAGASLSTLTALVAKSLLRRATSGRYDLHELIRQYALAQLHPEAQEAAEIRQRHSDYYAALLERRGAQLKGKDRTAVVAELVAELDNVRSSWQWAAEHQRAEALSQAADTLFWLYESRSNCREGVPLFHQAVTRLPTLTEAPTASGPSARQPHLALAQLLSYEGYFCFRQGQHVLGRELLQRSVALLRPLTDAPSSAARSALATSIAFLGAVTHAMGDYDEGQRLLNEGLALKQQLGDRWGAAFCLRELGLAAYAQGDPQAAYEQLGKSLALSREMGNNWATSVALNYLGTAAYALGALQEARQLQQEALALSRQLEDRFNAAYALQGLGRISHALGEYAPARSYFEESLGLSREIGDLGSVAQCLTRLGHTLLALDEPVLVRRCFVEAIALARESQAIPIILDAVVGEAERLALTNDEPAALALLVHVLDHPAATQEARDYA